ncbi:MerR family transcriptional regulator [Desulfobulbus sp. AH-315-M07]|nr:MerR family transcriptional regulator [Desulfobulbus sp. AH-315-M07]
MIDTGLRIGEVATEAGVNVQTLRYYERRGLLAAPSRTRSGYRHYPPETVSVIRFIKRSQELGFTLNEIDELLRLRSDKRRNRNEMRDIAAAKIDDIDEKLRRLKAMKSALSQLYESCTCKSKKLDCPILEALEDAPRSRKRRTSS